MAVTAAYVTDAHSKHVRAMAVTAAYMTDAHSKVHSNMHEPWL